MIEVRPFSAALGAVVDGVDCTAASDDDVAAVRAAINEHLVVVLPGQDLDDEQHEAFMARFGPLHFHPFLRLMDVPETHVQMIEQTMESPSGVDNWHTDLVFVPEPVAFGSLHCLTAPPYGGGTEFANLFLAYEQLDDRWKAMVRGIELEYGLSQAMLDNFARYFGDEARQVWIDALAGTVHPLVRTHPESGRQGLYFSPNTGPKVLDMSQAAGQAVLDFLAGHCARPNITARWTWSAGDLLIWDERCTMHYGVRDGYPGERDMRRILVDGDKPYFDAAAG
ncbi:MAG: TauD/TfdA family dioxygenase [Actinomycetota bacterium]